MVSAQSAWFDLPTWWSSSYSYSSILLVPGWGLADFGKCSGLLACRADILRAKQMVFLLGSSRFRNSCGDCTPACMVSPRSDIDNRLEWVK